MASKEIKRNFLIVLYILGLTIILVL